MKTKWIAKVITYDGTQLCPLFAYENYSILGDSIVSWMGPCSIPLENMKDLEDVLDNSAICGDMMLHFIIEVFHQNLFSGVCMQRLFASIIKDELSECKSVVAKKMQLFREGDDIYFKNKKLSISIASQSVLSTQIHFAINITNEGTPVSTLCLSEMGVEPKSFALKVMQKFSQEFLSIVMATKKVRELGATSKNKINSPTKTKTRIEII